MKTFSSEKEKIQVDYSKINAPKNAKNFMPDVYRDGEMYICIFGTEKSQQISATGGSPIEAITNWEETFIEKQNKK